MKVTKSQLKELIRHAIVQEIKIPFSSSHIKQLKRAFKDMKGTLPDNNPLVQQIVTLLKKTDKKVLKQIASADIKYLSDKAKDILGEGKLTEEKYVIHAKVKKSVGGAGAKKFQPEKFMTGGQSFDFKKGQDILKKLKKMNSGIDYKLVKEGTCGYGENGELGEEPAGPHLIKKKLKEKQSAAVQRMAKKGMGVVTDGGRETIKVVKNERAAKMLVKKLKKSGKYNSPEAKAIKLEGKLTEAKETIFDVAARVMKDKQTYGYKTKKGLVKVDMQTANLLAKVFKKVNPKMKKILSDLGEKNPAQLVQTLQAVVK